MSNIQDMILSIKTVVEITKAMKGLNDLEKMQIKVIELQEAILAAQGAALTAQDDQFKMADRIRQLQDELARATNWEASKQRYQLITPFEGCQVYALKESYKETDPPHWICPQCYEDGRKSILIDGKNTNSLPTIRCTRCHFEIDKHTFDRRVYA